jgi:inosine kinase
MRFPGKRKTKHYFPVSERGPESLHEEREEEHLYIVGIDQLLVDIEAAVDEAELGMGKVK